jgi:hypothetical protein
VHRRSEVNVDVVLAFHFAHDLVKWLVMDSSDDVSQLAFVADDLGQAQEARQVRWSSYGGAGTDEDD